MIETTFRYVVSNWVIKADNNTPIHRITDDEIYGLLNIVISNLSRSEYDNIPEWIVQKEKSVKPEKLNASDIDYLKSVIVNEMISLEKKETKIKIPLGFMENKFLFSDMHDNGF